MADKIISRRTELEELKIQEGLVTDESLESTRRMLNMMHESEEAGIRTIEALDAQGEKLNNIEKGMDDINTGMSKAQKSLNRLKRCCNVCATPWKKVPTQDESYMEIQNGTVGNNTIVIDQPRRCYDERTPNDGTSVNPETGYIKRITNDAREDEMDANLCQVNSILTNLRGMAVDMNSVLNDQNNQIERITAKSEVNSVRLDQAKISANKMLNS
ncbi:synaptosomal-associated protein 25 isoform X1 [Calliphora vicina]|uniref:synaptosomal-associated protein 25 isoform X1 n=1 Tax=Calliphora vicina TaxID=7373 RepID=UPI00325BE785